MIGVLITLAFSLAAAGLGYWLVRPWLEPFDPRARLGISGLLGLGLIGLVTLPLGLLPGGFRWGLTVIGALAVVGLVVLGGRRAELWSMSRKPQGLEWLGVFLPLALGYIPLIGVLAPSTPLDWDSLAYHLAVPKIWIQAGQIVEVSFIHHSNFPFTIDNLFVWGLQWGGQSGAKAFMLAFYGFGLMALYGLARPFGTAAGLWAMLAFAAVPSVLWESGSAYIDVAHGLYAGLGAWLLLGPARTHAGSPWLGAILLGLAAGSKYTGLQTMVAVALVLPFVLEGSTLVRAKQWALVGLVASLVAAPWYAKNAIQVQNPVYPFFYEQFGGKNWNQFQADIYRNEQKTFGVPNDGPLSIPHAILGLAYQPGRYINPGQKLQITPQGPIGATGDPKGAIGFAMVLSFLLGTATARRQGWLGMAGFLVLSFLMWAALSQQSRYILSLAPPLAIMLGAMVASERNLGRILAGATAVQALVTLYLCQTLLLTPPRTQVALGALDPSEFQRRFIPFYAPAQILNLDNSVRRVALFDEVFGFLLDKPYYWANYGHSTEIGYEQMTSADDFVASLRRLGISHVYVNLQFRDPTFWQQRWLPAMGLGLSDSGWINHTPQPLPAAEREALFNDLQARWQPLLAEAVASGLLIHDSQPSTRYLIFRLRE